jgi:2-oxoglutarate ferredoxin oxidoreductase subunit delta
VIEARCKGCGYCIQFCPKDVLAFSDKFNAKGYYVPVNALPEACTGCRMCEMVCPDFAIYLVEDPVAAAAVPVKVTAAEEPKS